jgi:hypothetical protein
MPIIQVTTDFAGQVNVNPRLVRVNCNDNLTKVTSPGYLADHLLLPTDFVCVSYSGGQGIFTPSFSGTIVTLVAQVPSVDLPTVSGNLPVFEDTIGNTVDSGVALTAVQLKANIKAFVYSYAGGSATATVPLAGVTTSSVAIADIFTAVNPAVINTVKILAPNNLTIVFSADPGASTINIVAFIAPQ